MAVGNIGCFNSCLQLMNDRGRYSRDNYPTLGFPLAMPANVEVTTATKLDLEPGTRVAVVDGVSGVIFAYSGNSDSDDLTSGNGIRCPEGRRTEVPIGFTNGVLHDKLLVVEGEEGD